MSDIEKILTENSEYESAFNPSYLGGASLPSTFVPQGGSMTLYQSDYTKKMDPSGGGSGHDPYTEYNDVTLSDLRYWMRNKEGTVYEKCNLVAIDMLQCRTSSMHFIECEIMRLRMVPVAMHATGMVFQKCTFGMPTRPLSRAYPMRKNRGIETDTTLIANIDATVFGPVNPWERKVSTTPRDGGSEFLGMLGYASEEAPEITVYTYPELFVNRITGKEYSQTYAGVGAFSRWQREEEASAVDARYDDSFTSHTVIVLKDPRKVRRGQYVKEVYDNDRVGVVVATKTEDGSWNTTSAEEQDNVKYVRLSRPVAQAFINASNTWKVIGLWMPVKIGDDPPSIGDHNEPVDKNLMIHSTQSLYRFPSSSFVPTESEDPEAEKAKDDLKAVVNAEDPVAVWNQNELCRPPYHHEYTHTTIERLRNWAARQDRAYFISAKFESCTMRDIIFINCDFIRGTFKECEMTHCWFINCTFSGCEFVKNKIVDCPGINFKHAVIEGGSIECTIPFNSNKLDFRYCQIRAPPTITAPTFTVDLTRAVALDEYVIDNENWDIKAHVGFKSLDEDAVFHNGSFMEGLVVTSDLYEDAEFDNWKFNRSIITRTDFKNSTFHRVLYKEGKLLHAVLKQCDLKHTEFQECHMKDVLFRECDLDDVELSLDSGVRFVRCSLKDVMMKKFNVQNVDDTIDRFEMEFCDFSSRVNPDDVTLMRQARIARSTMINKDTNVMHMEASSLRDSRVGFGHSQEEQDAIIDDAFNGPSETGLVMEESADLTNARVEGLIQLRSNDDGLPLKCYVSRNTYAQAFHMTGEIEFATLSDLYRGVEGRPVGKLFAVSLSLTRSIVHFTDDDEDLLPTDGVRILAAKVNGKGRHRTFEFNKNSKSTKYSVQRIELEGEVDVGLWQKHDLKQGELDGEILYSDDQYVYVLADADFKEGAANLIQHKTNFQGTYEKLTGTTLHTSAASSVDPAGGLIEVVVGNETRKYSYTSVDTEKKEINNLSLLDTRTNSLGNRLKIVRELSDDRSVAVIAEVTRVDDFYIVPTGLNGVYEWTTMDKVSAVDLSYINMNSKEEFDPGMTHSMRTLANGEEKVEDYTIRYDAVSDSVVVGQSVGEWALTNKAVAQCELSYEHYACRYVRADSEFLYVNFIARPDPVNRNVAVARNLVSDTITVPVTNPEESLVKNDLMLVTDMCTRDVSSTAFSALGFVLHAPLGPTFRFLGHNSETTFMAGVEYENGIEKLDTCMVVTLKTRSHGDVTGCRVRMALEDKILVERVSGSFPTTMEVTAFVVDGETEEQEVTSTKAGMSQISTISHTTVNKNIKEHPGTFNVESTKEFPKRGTFYVGTERFSYVSKTATSFRGVRREGTITKDILPAGHPVTLFRFDSDDVEIDTLGAWASGEFDSVATLDTFLSSVTVTAEREGITFGTITGVDANTYYGHVRFPMYVNMFGKMNINSLRITTATGDEKSFPVEKDSIGLVYGDVVLFKDQEVVPAAGDEANEVHLFKDATERGFPSTGRVSLRFAGEDVDASAISVLDYTGISDNVLTGVTACNLVPPAKTSARAYLVDANDRAIARATYRAQYKTDLAAAQSVTFVRTCGLTQVSEVNTDNIVMKTPTNYGHTVYSKTGQLTEDTQTVNLSIARECPSFDKFALVGGGGPHTTKRSEYIDRVFHLDGVPQVEKVGQSYRVTAKSKHNGTIDAFRKIDFLMGDSESCCSLVPGNGSGKHLAEMKSILDVLGNPTLEVAGVEKTEGVTFWESSNEFTVGSGGGCPIQTYNFPKGEVFPPTHYVPTTRVPDRERITIRAHHPDIKLETKKEEVKITVEGLTLEASDLTTFSAGDVFDGIKDGEDPVETIGSVRSRFDSEIPDSEKNQASIVSLYRDDKDRVIVGASLQLLSSEDGGLRVSGNKFDNKYFESCWMEHAIFSGCTFTNCIFSSLCNLTGADFSNCTFNNCVMHIGPYTIGGMDFRNSKFVNSTIDARDTGIARSLNNVRMQGATFDDDSAILPKDMFIKIWDSSKVGAGIPMTHTQTLNMAYFRKGEAANMRDTDLSGVNLTDTDFYLADFGNSYMDGALAHPSGMGLTIMTPSTTVPKTIKASSAMTFSSGRARNSQLVDKVQRSDLRDSNLSAIPITRGAKFNYSIYNDATEWPSYIDPANHIPGAIDVTKGKNNLANADLTGLQMKTAHGLKDETPLARIQKVLESNGEVALFHKVANALDFDGGSRIIRNSYTNATRAGGIFMRALALESASDEQAVHLMKQYRHLWRKLHASSISPNSSFCDADIIAAAEKKARVYVSGFLSDKAQENKTNKQLLRDEKLRELEMTGVIRDGDIFNDWTYGGEKTPNATGTAGENTVVVSSAEGIEKDMVVSGVGILGGTVVNSVSGTTVTLSTALTQNLIDDPVTFKVDWVKKGVAPTENLTGGSTEFATLLDDFGLFSSRGFVSHYLRPVKSSIVELKSDGSWEHVMHFAERGEACPRGGDPRVNPNFNNNIFNTVLTLDPDPWKEQTKNYRRTGWGPKTVQPEVIFTKEKKHVTVPIFLGSYEKTSWRLHNALGGRAFHEPLGYGGDTRRATRVYYLNVSSIFPLCNRGIGTENYESQIGKGLPDLVMKNGKPATAKRESQGFFGNIGRQFNNNVAAPILEKVSEGLNRVLKALEELSNTANEVIKSGVALVASTTKTLTVDSTEGLVVGMRVSGTGIAAAATIESIVNDTTLTISHDVTEPITGDVVFSKSGAKATDHTITQAMQDAGLKAKFTRALQTMEGTFLDINLPVQSTEHFQDDGGVFLVKLSEPKESRYVHYKGKSGNMLTGVSNYDPDLIIEKFDVLTAVDILPDTAEDSPDKGGMYPGCLPHLVDLRYELKKEMIPPNFERDRDLWIEADIPVYYYTADDVHYMNKQYWKNTYGKDFDWDDESTHGSAGGFHKALVDTNTQSWADNSNFYDWWDDVTTPDFGGDFHPPLHARYMRLRVRKRIGTAYRNIKTFDRKLALDYYGKVGLGSGGARGRVTFPEFMYSNSIFEAYSTHLTTAGQISIMNNTNKGGTGRQITVRDPATPWVRHRLGKVSRMDRNFSTPAEPVDSQSKLDILSSCTWDLVRRHAQKKFKSDKLIMMYEDPQSGSGMSSVRKFGDIFPAGFHVQNPVVMAMSNDGFCAIQADGTLATCVEREAVNPPKDTFRTVVSSRDSFSAVTENNQQVLLALQSGGDSGMYDIAGGGIDRNGTTVEDALHTLTLINKLNGDDILQQFNVFVSSTAALQATGILGVGDLTGVDASLFDGDKKLTGVAKDFYQLIHGGQPLIVSTHATTAVPAAIVTEWVGAAIPGYMVYNLSSQKTWTKVTFADGGANLQVKTLVSDTGMPTPIVAARMGNMFAAVTPDTMVQNGLTYNREYGDAVWWKDGEAHTLFRDTSKKKSVVACGSGFLVLHATGDEMGKPLYCQIGQKEMDIDANTKALTCKTIVASNNTGFAAICKDAGGTLSLKSFGQSSFAPTLPDPTHVFASDKGFIALSAGQAMVWGDYEDFGTFAPQSNNSYFMINATMDTTVLTHGDHIVLRRTDTDAVLLDGVDTGIQDVFVDFVMYKPDETTELAYLLTSRGTVTVYDGSQSKDLGGNFSSLTLVGGVEGVVAMSEGGETKTFNGSSMIDSITPPTGLNTTTTPQKATYVSHDDTTLTVKLDAKLEKNVPKDSVVTLQSANYSIDAVVARASTKGRRELMLVRNRTTTIDGQINVGGASFVSILGDSESEYTTSTGAARHRKATGLFGDLRINHTDGAFTYIPDSTNTAPGVDVFPVLKWPSRPAASDEVHVVHFPWIKEYPGKYGGHRATVQSVTNGDTVTVTTDNAWPSSGGALALSETTKTLVVSRMVGNETLVQTKERNVDVYGYMELGDRLVRFKDLRLREYRTHIKSVTLSNGLTIDSLPTSTGWLDGEFVLEGRNPWNRKDQTETLDATVTNGQITSLSSTVSAGWNNVGKFRPWMYSNLSYSGGILSRSTYDYYNLINRVTKTFTGTSNSKILTVDSTEGLTVGMRVSGNYGIADRTTIESIDNGTQFTISKTWNPDSGTTTGSIVISRSGTEGYDEHIKLSSCSFPEKTIVKVADQGVLKTDTGVVEINGKMYDYVLRSGNVIVIDGHIPHQAGAEVIYREYGASTDDFIVDDNHALEVGDSLTLLEPKHYPSYTFSGADTFTISNFDGGKYLLESVRCRVSSTDADAVPSPFNLISNYKLDALGNFTTENKYEVNSVKYDLSWLNAEIPLQVEVPITSIAIFPEKEDAVINTQELLSQKPDIATVVKPTTARYRSRLTRGYDEGEIVTGLEVEDASAFPESGTLIILGRVKSVKGGNHQIATHVSRIKFDAPASGGSTATATWEAPHSTGFVKHGPGDWWFGGTISYPDYRVTSKNLTRFELYGVSLTYGGDGYYQTPNAKFEYNWEPLKASGRIAPQNPSGATLEDYQRWQSLVTPKLRLTMYGPIKEIVYTSKTGNVLNLKEELVMPESIPALLIESQPPTWTAAIKSQSSLRNVRRIVSNGNGSAALLKTNRLSDVCMNCKKCSDQIVVNGKYGTKINVYKCLGHRALPWDLSKETLSSIVFSGATLNFVTYIDSNLEDADFLTASVTKSAFTRANLRRANMKRAEFRKCDFTDADLTGADLSGAQVVSCDFTRARLNEITVDEKTDFVDCVFDSSTVRFVAFPENSTTFRGSKTQFLNVDFRQSTGKIPRTSRARETVVDSVTSYDYDSDDDTTLSISSFFSGSVPTRGRFVVYKAGSSTVSSGTYSGRTGSKLLNLTWTDTNRPEAGSKVVVTDDVVCKLSPTASILNLSFAHMPNCLGPNGENLREFATVRETVLSGRYVSFTDDPLMNINTRFDR